MVFAPNITAMQSILEIFSSRPFIIISLSGTINAQSGWRDKDGDFFNLGLSDNAVGIVR